MNNNDNLSREILRRILDGIDKAGIDQKTLAQKIEINSTTVTNWKTGKSFSYTKPEMLSRIAIVLNTTTDYLMTGQEKPTPEDGDGPNPLDSRLNELLARESDETKRAMIAFLESLQKP